MNVSTWWPFFALSLAAVLTPGPAMLAIFGHSLSHGAPATLAVVAGNVLGAVVLMAGSVAGLSALLSAAPGALSALKWAGAAYLVWLGLRSFRGGARPEAPVAQPRSGGLLRGFVIALSNPKALVFFGAVLPQFVDATRPAFPQFAAAAGTFAALELCVTSAVTFGAQALTPVFRRGRALVAVRRAGGLAMIAASLVLVVGR